MDHFPVFLKLAGRAVLVVGGGAVAARKVALLSAAGARIHVVAPAIESGLLARLAEDGHSWRRGAFEPADLDGRVLVIAATGDRVVNVAVAASADARSLPVNVVDDPALCSVIMPAIVDRGAVVVAISTGGASPTLARHLRNRLEAILPASVGALAVQAAQLRDRVRAIVPEPLARRRFWDVLLDRALQTGTLPDPDSLIAETGRPAGRLAIAEVPLDDPEGVSLRAIRLIATADLLIHEAAVPADVLGFARRDADRRVLCGDPAEAAVDAIAEGRFVVAVVGSDKTR